MEYDISKIAPLNVDILGLSNYTLEMNKQTT